MAAFHNSRSVSSEKSEENSALPVETPEPRRKRFAMTEAMQAAISLVKRFGLTHSHRLLYIVELAILAECEFREISIPEAASNIREGALAEITRGGSLNYFFFEDCGWRYPRLSFKERDEMRIRAEAAVGAGLSDWGGPKCSRCNDRGYVFNYGPGERTRPCPECGVEASA